MNNNFLPKTFDKEIDSPYCSELQKGSSASEIHWHSGMEIIYMLKGQSKVFFDEKWQLLKQGSLLFVPTGKLHCCICQDDGAEKIVAGFSEKCFDKDVLNKILLKDVEKHCILDGLENTEIHMLLQSFNAICQDKKIISRLRAKAYIYDVFSLLIERWQSLGIEVDDTFNESLHDEIMEYINTHFTEDISPYTTAKHLNVSYSYLAKKMKALSKISFTKVVNHARVELAKKKLITQDKNITEISFECGFSDVSYFIKTFRIFTGMTPKEFRNLKRG